MHRDKAVEGMQFNIEALKIAHGVESGDLLSVVKEKQDLSEVYLTNIDYFGEKTYDSQDRPAKISTEARDAVNRILGDADKANYHRARAIARVGKTELVQKNQSRCQELMLEAQTQISLYFGSEHIMMAKFNQNLVEAYNLADKSQA